MPENFRLDEKGKTPEKKSRRIRNNEETQGFLFLEILLVYTLLIWQTF